MFIGHTDKHVRFNKALNSVQEEEDEMEFSGEEQHASVSAAEHNHSVCAHHHHQPRGEPLAGFIFTAWFIALSLVMALVGSYFTRCDPFTVRGLRTGVYVFRMCFTSYGATLRELTL